MKEDFNKLDKNKLENSSLSSDEARRKEKRKNIYQKMSYDELNQEWEKIKSVLHKADKEKDEENYDKNYQKIKEIEAARESLVYKEDLAKKRKKPEISKYKKMSFDQLSKEWDKVKEILFKAEEEKDEESYRINYEKIKEIEFRKNLLELKNERSKIRKEIDKAEKNKEESSVIEAEEKIRKVEEKINSTKTEFNQEIKKGGLKEELKDTEKKDEAKEVNKEILRVLEEINVKVEDIKNIKGFEDLSPGAQLLALNNYKQIIDDDAVELGSEKFAEIKRAKKEKYQEKYGKKRGSIFSGIASIFSKTKKKEAAYKESLSEIKNKEFDSKLFALEASVNWVTGADISAEIKEGKIEFNFINKSEINEEANEIVDELNSIANKFAKMPQYLSNISAKKSDRKKYEKTKQELEAKKLELVEALEGKESDSDIINQLNKLNFKITNLQNNLTDEEINELEKNNSKFLKLFKSKKAEKGYYFIGGMVARMGIKRKFSETAADEALEAGLGTGVTALASYGTLGVVAAIGGFRGWTKAEKNIREDDKKIGKKDETEVMKTRRDKLETLRKASPEDMEQAQKEFDEANKNFLKEQMKNKTEANFIFASKACNKIEKLMENINTLHSKENLSKDEKNKLKQLKESLKNRLNYTKNKIDDGLIALGSGANRLVNSSNLFNFIAKGEMLIEDLDHEEMKESSNKEDYESEESFEKKSKILQSNKVTDFIPDEFIDENGKVNIVAWLNQASPEEISAYRQRKIEGYLNVRSRKIDTKRRNYKIKKAAIGAVSGVALAYGGMKSFDALSQTEIGQVVGEKLSNSLSWGVDQGGEAISYLKESLGAVEGLEQAVPSVDEIDVVTGAIVNSVAESVAEGAVMEEGQEEVFKSLSRTISNEELDPGKTDSVWRSARTLFIV